MMTREMMITAIEALKEDASYFDGIEMIYVTLEDSSGFEAREYSDEDAVCAFIEMLGRECLSQKGEFYRIYEFEGFSIKLGCSSFDI